MTGPFPRLYAILDSTLVSSREPEIAAILAEAGTGMIQYRNKAAAPARVVEISSAIAAVLRATKAHFVINDRADVAAVVEASGVHVGQDDLSVAGARRVFECTGRERGTFVVGVSTHTLEQVKAADATEADYIAFGPVFETATKAKPDATVGAGLLSEARKLTRKPLVAIGGITVERAAEVYRAGADCIAVARDLVAAPHPGVRAQQYLEIAQHG